MLSTRHLLTDIMGVSPYTLSVAFGLCSLQGNMCNRLHLYNIFTCDDAES